MVTDCVASGDARQWKARHECVTEVDSDEVTENEEAVDVGE